MRGRLAVKRSVAAPYNGRGTVVGRCKAVVVLLRITPPPKGIEEMRPGSPPDDGTRPSRCLWVDFRYRSPGLCPRAMSEYPGRYVCVPSPPCRRQRQEPTASTRSMALELDEHGVSAVRGCAVWPRVRGPARSVQVRAIRSMRVKLRAVRVRAPNAWTRPDSCDFIDHQSRKAPFPRFVASDHFWPPRRKWARRILPLPPPKGWEYQQLMATGPAPYRRQRL